MTSPLEGFDGKFLTRQKKKIGIFYFEFIK